MMLPEGNPGATDQIRSVDQSQESPTDWHHHSAEPARTGRSELDDSQGHEFFNGPPQRIEVRRVWR
jgi:hypothetical protein